MGMKDQELKDLVASLSVSQEKTDHQIQELSVSQEKTDHQIQELSVSQEKTDHQIQELSVSQKETDRQIKETDRILTEKFTETDRKLEKVADFYGGLSKNIGFAVEEFFYRYFFAHPKLGPIEFQDVKRNLKGLRREYDLTMINGDIVVLTEIKHKIHPNQIDKLLLKKIPDFKLDYPELAGHKLFGAIASFSIPDKIEKMAKEKGLFVLAQSGEKVNVLNEEAFEPTEH